MPDEGELPQRRVEFVDALLPQVIAPARRAGHDDVEPPVALEPQRCRATFPPLDVRGRHLDATDPVEPTAASAPSVLELFSCHRRSSAMQAPNIHVQKWVVPSAGSSMQ